MKNFKNILACMLIIVSICTIINTSKVNAASITTTGTALKAETAYLSPNSSRTIYNTWQNDKLFVLCKAGNLYLIAYPWLSSVPSEGSVVYAYVSTSSVKANGNVPDASSYFDINCSGTVNTPGSSLRLRVQPSTNPLYNKGNDISIIELLPHNTTLQVLFEMNGWYYVEVYGIRGFVSKEYVTLSTNQGTASYAKPIPQYPNQGGYIGFGDLNSAYQGKLHAGVDMKTDAGTPVVSILDGKVIMASNDYSGYGADGGKGGAVVVQHINKNGQIFYALYGHLNVSVVVGQTVQRGQQLGTIRIYSWNGTRMDHLHFGINTITATVTGYAVNPSESGFVDPIKYLDNYCK